MDAFLLALAIAPLPVSAQTGSSVFSAPPGASTAAAHPPEAAPAAGSAEALEPAIDGLRHEVDALLDKLQLVQNRYQDIDHVESLAPERDRLRAEVLSRMAKYSELDDEFDIKRNTQEASTIQGALMQFMGGVMPKDAFGVYARAKGLTDYSHELRQWETGAKGRLVADDAAFKAAMNVARQHRFLKWGAGALLAGLIVVGAVLFRTSRVKSRLETDIFKLAAASGTVYQGIGTVPGAAPTGGAGPTATVLGGNYVVDKELGHGGMGVVYEATDLSLRRKVAIKKLRDELYERASDLELLLSEARLVAGLKHPNIVEIHSIFKENGRVYLVFEHVSGRTLLEALGELGQLTVRQAKSVLRQMGAALDYAHSRRVIHRDLKPANVMVTAEGVVKVMDFGIAHQAKATVAKLTRSEAWGTPPYMAPEQEMGTVSKESDIYALGVCLYEMLTGKLPFDGPNYLAQKNAMKFAPPTKSRAGLPPGLDAVVARALVPDPAGRFHSAAEIIAAVEALPDGA